MRLTQQRLRELLHYDPETGVFVWRVARRGHIRGSRVAGSLRPDGYVKIGVDRVHYLAHRLAWFWMLGRWPREDTDHRNRVRHDNRWANLRACNRSFNMQNQVQANRKNKSTGVLGVHRAKPNARFVAHIVVDGKDRHLGAFDTPELAQAAYLAAKRVHHAGCTI